TVLSRRMKGPAGCGIHFDGDPSPSLSQARKAPALGRPAAIARVLHSLSAALIPPSSILPMYVLLVTKTTSPLNKQASEHISPSAPFFSPRSHSSNGFWTS